MPIANSFRETRVCQEAFDEGVQTIASRMLVKKMPIEDIAELTGLTTPAIKKLQKKPC